MDCLITHRRLSQKKLVDSLCVGGVGGSKKIHTYTHVKLTHACTQYVFEKKVLVSVNQSVRKNILA